MLAIDEKGRLSEFETASNIVVCGKCHRLYRQTRTEQIPGFREREEDVCPYCDYENGSSMNYDFYNYALSDEEYKKLKKTSLIKSVIEYCHEQYINSSCESCEHTNGCPGMCRGYCKTCLEEVHYPGRYPNGKKDYDCEKMLHFYVCDYSAKYTSEMIRLMRKSEVLRNIEEYHVLSIGCGGCPDLMAFEKYCHESDYNKTVSYIGIDKNEKWAPIHEKIGSYKTKTIKKTQFLYMDAVTENYNILKANVIVLQYVISHFYNTGQISQINAFFDKLVDNIIAHKEQGKPLVLLINDVNSNNRGRDYFQRLVSKLDEKGFSQNSQRYYFDYNIQNDFQRYGTRHESTRIVFQIPDYLRRYQPWESCSSAQLLIEVQ